MENRSDIVRHLGMLAGRQILGQQYCLEQENLKRVLATLETLRSLDLDPKNWDVSTLMNAMTEWCPEFVREVSSSETIEFLDGARMAVLNSTDLPKWHLETN